MKKSLFFQKSMFPTSFRNTPLTSNAVQLFKKYTWGLESKRTTFIYYLPYLLTMWLRETVLLSICFLTFKMGGWGITKLDHYKTEHKAYKGLNLLAGSVQFSSVSQSCPILWDSMDYSTPGFLSITSSQSLLKLMSIESVMPSNHLILCRSLLLLPSIFPSIRVFSN